MTTETYHLIVKKERTVNVWVCGGEEGFLQKAYSSGSAKGSKEASGLDLVCPNDVVLPGGVRGAIVKMGIKVIAEVTRNKKFRIEHHGPLPHGDGWVVPIRTTQKVTDQTGFCIYLRSSTPIKTPLRMANNVGIIDADYRGEIGLILDNISSEPYTIRKGDMIAQICLPSLKKFEVEVRDDAIPTSERGEGGMGSTGSNVENRESSSLANVVYKAVEESLKDDSILEPC